MSHIDEGLLHAYIDGQCSTRERDEIEQHLSSCNHCLARLHEAETLIHGASRLLDQVESGPVTRPPWREIEARAAARGQLAKRRLWTKPSLAWAASIAIAFGVGWFANTMFVEPRVAPLEVPLASEAPTPTRGLGASDEANTALRNAAKERDAARPTGGRLAETGATPTQATPSADREGADRARRARADVLAQQATPLQAEEAAPAPAIMADRLEPQAPAQEERLARESTAAPANRVDSLQIAGAVVDKAAAAFAETEARQREDADLLAKEDAERQNLPGEGALAESKAEPADARKAISALEEPPELAANARFRQIEPEEAESRMGVPMRTLPELELQHVEIGPATAAQRRQEGQGGQGGQEGEEGLGERAESPLVRLTYKDAAGAEIILTQQLAQDVSNEDDEPTLIVEPSGITTYRWLDGRYRLTLTGELTSDSLRALAERVE